MAKKKSCKTGYVFIGIGAIPVALLALYTPQNQALTTAMVAFSIGAIALGTYGLVKKPKLVCGKWGLKR